MRRKMKAIQKIFLSIALISLCSCGFKPIYSSSKGSAVLSQIKISIVNEEPLPTKLGVILKDNLKNRFNPTGIVIDPKYELILKLSTVLTSYETKQNTVTTRRSIKLIADYRLINILTKKEVLKDIVTSVDSFQIADSPYSAIIVEEGTSFNMTREMANEISNRISAFETDKDL